MRHPIAKIATAAVAVPMTGALLLAATPASAAPVGPATRASSVTTTSPLTAVSTGTATTTTKAADDDAYSTFSVQVTGPKKAKPGGEITYRIKGLNKGPWTADDYYFGGTLPKGIRGTVYFDGPKGTKCGFFPDGFWCWPPYVLEKGEDSWLTITVRLKKGTKGTVAAKLGVNSWDWPTGSENLSREELKKIGIKSWYFTKSVKTKIVG
ncbi:hypothetical protein DQ384_16470 [Sphaerisporangium album]|uniref:DUF11 domain-containing protein n=2 Tax=Sphaerisporangium album TaxID=509200 RepID=A0A367FIW4_9ACTN|nr:hypothetical protein DQ384_16470 [Sphaerisporangium album]